MKKSIAPCLIMLALAALSNIASADVPNGGFESGMTGWTKEYSQDGSNGGDSNELYVTDSYHHSGQNALWGKAYIVGIDTFPQYDWSRTYVWSGSQDLSSVTSIKLYLTDFQSSNSHSNWGWGQEVFLVLDDGTNQASALLIDNHEPVYTSLFDRGFYTTSEGSDERDWYGFDVHLSTDPNYFGAGFSILDLSSTKVGICWEAISWFGNTGFGPLWAGAYVDDIQLVPEPATICLLGLGALAFFRKRKT